MKIHDLLDNNIDNIKDQICCIENDIQLTFGEVQNESYNLAYKLNMKGISHQDRVLIISENRIEMIPLIIAISRIGGIFTIIDNQTSLKNLEYIVDDLRPKLVITDKRSIDNYNKVTFSEIFKFSNVNRNYCNEKKDTETISHIIYTSGSTGHPKGVISTHENVIFCTKAISKELDINSFDVIGILLPFSFDYGLYQIFMAISNKCTLVIWNSKIIGPELIKELNVNRVTIFPVLPNLLEIFLKIHKRFGSESEVFIKKITNTGDFMDENLIENLLKQLPNVSLFSMYGLTECKRVSILQADMIKKKIGSVGKPIKGVECFVLDEKSKKIQKNGIGELVVIGPNVMMGYWNDKILTEKVFGSYNSNKLYTGDIFRIDEQGFLYFLSRKDNIKKIKGFRVSLLEIKQTFYDLSLGNKVEVIYDESKRKLLMYTQTNLTEEYIRSKLSEYLEYYKIPDKIYIIDIFPLNNNYKLDKKKLKEMCQDH